METLEIHDPFNVPSQMELEQYEDSKPRWWYAAQLRVAGAQWDEIAQVLGYSSQQTARQAVKHARKDRDTETLEDIVDLELQRLDMLQLTQWRQAQKGDAKATMVILAIMNLRMKLLGTEKKPDVVEGTTNNTAIFIGGDSKDYIEALRTARNAGKAINVGAEDVNA